MSVGVFRESTPLSTIVSRFIGITRLYTTEP